MFLYVYVADPGNAAAKFRMQSATRINIGGGGASNRRHAFNMVRLLLVPQ
jgi:hypothetical protein